MAQITSREELEAWLKDKPVNFARVIAARAALRVLPYAFDPRTPNAWVETHSLALFRATAISWAARNFSAHDMRSAANAAARAFDSFVGAAGSGFATHAASNSAASAAVAADAVVGAGSAANSSADAIADAAADSAFAAGSAFAGGAEADTVAGDAAAAADFVAWAAISYDSERLVGFIDTDSAPRRLTGEKLWTLSTPRGWHQVWSSSARRLAAFNKGYSVWIDWYNRRIEGHYAAFDIPGDTDRTHDKAILARLADATNEDFWDKGATYVNTTLQGWIDEARERVAPSKLTKAEVQVAVVKYASPDARIVDDRFDAGPNATFDKPRYDGDLATLPSQLRAFIGALSASLPRNAPDVIRHCLTAYNDELLARGTQPIVSIVKGMASAIAAQVWIAPDEADKDDPDGWVLKDPSEWEPGTADLFRTFFKAHLDLITHFPLDPEREAMLAATPIDEVAASDKALTDPIDKVTDLIITLAKDGHATDNIVRIVKALADYTRDIAGMPKPDEAGLPSTTITPKRRHVLQTAGFYLHAYSILGTTATLSTLPQVQTLMTALADAAERLMAFIL